MFFLNLDSPESSYKYDMSRFMELVSQYDPISSYLINNIRKLPYIKSYKIEAEEGRADLLSYNLYGTTKFWWLLLLYNRKVCPFDLKRGEYIKYPSMMTLDDFYVELRALQGKNTNLIKYF